MRTYRLSHLFRALSLTDAQIADEVQELTGVQMTRQLVSHVAAGQPIPAVNAQALCTWLSQECNTMQRHVTPEYLADPRVHPLSSLPADTGGESFRAEKIDGFLAGFQRAYDARSRHQILSTTAVRQLAEQATSRHLQEIAGSRLPRGSADAYHNVWTPCGRSMSLRRSRCTSF